MADPFIPDNVAPDLAPLYNWLAPDPDRQYGAIDLANSTHSGALTNRGIGMLLSNGAGAGGALAEKAPLPPMGGGGGNAQILVLRRLQRTIRIGWLGLNLWVSIGFAGCFTGRRGRISWPSRFILQFLRYPGGHSYGRVYGRPQIRMLPLNSHFFGRKEPPALHVFCHWSLASTNGPTWIGPIATIPMTLPGRCRMLSCPATTRSDYVIIPATAVSVTRRSGRSAIPTNCARRSLHSIRRRGTAPTCWLPGPAYRASGRSRRRRVSGRSRTIQRACRITCE